MVLMARFYGYSDVRLTDLFYLGDAFDYLDSPPIRVSGADVPLAYAKTLEQHSMPQVANVVKSIKKILNK